MMIGSWRILKASILLALISSCERATPVEEEAGTRVPYTPTVADPGRGLYRHTQRKHASEEGISVEQLKEWRSEGTSLILRVFYLGEFTDSEISSEYLEAITSDFSTMREAGLKGIIRFAYSSDLKQDGKDQAGLELVLKHLEQLAPILLSEANVIHCVQAGFIGAWGEWHAAHPDFREQDGSLKPAACRKLIAALLEAVPEPLYLQVRTPWQKMMLFEGNAPGASRVGHHNDCFLASDDDYGTYRNVEGEMAWLEQETRTLPMGGETCAINTPRSSGASAIREMERLHYNYLNSSYHTGVLDSWRADGSYAEIARRLGHRIRISKVDVVDDSVTIHLLNEGFAAPLYERPMEYQWSDSGKNTSGEVDDFSMLSLAPGSVQTVEIPRSKGALELRWPDSSPGLRERGEYAVRLANPEMPRDRSGWHRVVLKN